MAATAFDHKEFLSRLTEQPGCYRMIDAQGTVIYVGKAKNLKKRVSSYFRSNLEHAKTRVLVKHIASIEITVTLTEAEALLLENNLIKQFRPRYNVLLRDDKSFPYILLTDHQHPQLTIHRGAKKKKGSYFGPYPNPGAVWESLRLLQKIFPVRQCEDAYYRARSRPCLQYQLKRCSAPCVGMISDDNYAEQVQLLTQFLRGKSQGVINQISDKMAAASEAMEFEQAAAYRDQLIALRKVQEQHWVSGQTQELDIIGFAREAGGCCIQLLHIREQRIIGSKSYFPKTPNDAEDRDIVEAFIKQHYASTASTGQLPKQIVLPMAIVDVDAVTHMLQELASKKTSMVFKVRSEKARYLKLANVNAQTALLSHLSQKSSIQKRYAELNDALEVSTPITRMECFDISHTMGQQTIASCVVFNHEGPFKTDYRRYNVEGITPGDDYAAMRFALAKRYKSADVVEKLPSVIFIDGGKGQLSQAEAFFADWPLDKTPLLVGIAKGTSRKPGLETLILSGSHRQLTLPTHSPALHLIQHIRDEAHRFAIAGHRNKRGKIKRTSTLENIAGIGPKKRKALLQYLGGLQEVVKASVDELAKVPGISRELAEMIHGEFHQ